MVSIKLIKSLDLETIQDYFDYIIESKKMDNINKLKNFI
jgi:hypothetical protein